MTLPKFSLRLAEGIVAWRWALLALAALLAMAAWFTAGKLQFDRSVENMFAANDPLMGPYHKLKRIFGGEQLVLAVYVDPELLDEDGTGIRRLDQLTARLVKVPGVRDAVSLATINNTLDQLKGTPDAGVGVPSILAPGDGLAARFRNAFAGYTHGADGQTAAVVCILAPQQDADVPSRRQTVADLRAVMRDLPDGLNPGVIAGEPVMVVDGFRYIEQDANWLSLASLVLLAGVIILSFRSLRWVVIPLVVVGLAILLTKAVLVWTGLRLSMVSSILSSIVTVVGVATVVHVIVRFREARTHGLTARDALVRATALLAAPIFWACSTDAVGFLSLTISSVGPVRDFGLMMAIGSMVVLLCVALVVPGLVLLGRFDADPRRAWGEHLLDLELSRMTRWVEHHPLSVGGGALLVVAAATLGIFRLEVETDFTRNFRAESPIVRSYTVIEDRLGGAGVWDVLAPIEGEFGGDTYLRLRHLQSRLRNEAGVGEPVAAQEDGQQDKQQREASPARLTKVLSLADILAAASPADLELIPLDTLRQAAVQAGVSEMQRRMPSYVGALYQADPEHPEQKYVRIMLRARERQPAAAKRQLIEDVERISREEFPGAEVSGFFVLLAHLIESMLRDQWTTFGLAAAGIGLMMLVALRSPVLAVVALVPNALPILVVLGLLGWLGLKINMGTAMIAAVSMGLSVDSSIHYIISFQRARRDGYAVYDALDIVQQSVGRAMVFSTLALVVGFTVLCTSNFIPTIYFGALVSLSMLGGLAGNLLVLPLLLKWTSR